MAATDENANTTDITHRLFLLDGANPLVIGENVHQLSEGTTGLSAWQVKIVYLFKTMLYYFHFKANTFQTNLALLQQNAQKVYDIL